MKKIVGQVFPYGGYPGMMPNPMMGGAPPPNPLSEFTKSLQNPDFLNMWNQMEPWNQLKTRRKPPRSTGYSGASRKTEEGRPTTPRSTHRQ